MSIEELEAEAMKLDPTARARLAGKLLESLDTHSEAENERSWAADEAGRRDGDPVPQGACHHYLVRSLTPYAGS